MTTSPWKSEHSRRAAASPSSIRQEVACWNAFSTCAEMTNAHTPKGDVSVPRIPTTAERFSSTPHCILPRVRVNSLVANAFQQRLGRLLRVILEHLTQGGRFGGWGLLLVDGKPEFDYAFSNHKEHKYRVASSEKLAPGPHTLKI